MFSEHNSKSVVIQLEDVTLRGTLAIPEHASGIVIFSHGSGSSRLSPRNNYVAGILQKNGLATLLFDLLTDVEDSKYETRFDIDLLTRRLIATTHWIKNISKTEALDICYFGASTGAASALRAAAFFKDEIKAVVSRGGRPDMARDDLDKVTAPTLLIVGGLDDMVIRLNQQAFQKLRCERKLEIIPDATHLFEETGKLEEVAHLSARWFSEKTALKTPNNV